MKHKKRRWLEWGKSLLIILLSVSAVFLIGRSPLVQSSGLAETIGGSRTDNDDSLGISTLAAAPIPIQMAVNTGQGLYGVQYDQGAADTLFDQVSPLLGDALATAGQPETISLSQWRGRLTGGRCIYFDFSAPVPLSALEAWLKGETENLSLADSARWILLAEEGDGTISLCYGEEDGYYRCDTALDASLHLSPIVDGVTPNGAFFAFEDDVLGEIVQPYTLFADSEIRAVVYNSTTPTVLSDDAQAEALLDALSFGSQNRAVVPEGVLYVDGEDTLRLSGSGRVVYDDAGGERYPAGEGLAGAVEASWALASAALGSVCGDAELHMLSAREEGGGYIVTFGYVLNGSTVHLYDGGWAASFLVKEGVIREFTLYLRTYTATSQQVLLLPADKAAAALTALTDQPKELVVRYDDDGGSTVSPGWAGR